MECVDIIMPVYNCEKYVRIAIESVKKQTFSNWNLIIIDDKSTDNTIKEIEIAIENIKEKTILIKLDMNKGVANARNIGISNSKNRYIAFLDADDIWKEDKLEKQLNFMKENGYIFTYTSYRYLKKSRYKKIKKVPKYLSYKSALKNTFILTSTVIIDTKNITKDKLIMPNIGSEDTATWWNILKNGYTAYGYGEILTTYRITKYGLSYNKFVNIRRTWNLYRENEKLNIIKSAYYFLNYIYNAVKKRVA